jgi:hypothetical protein
MKVKPIMYPIINTAALPHPKDITTTMHKIQLVINKSIEQKTVDVYLGQHSSET